MAKSDFRLKGPQKKSFGGWDKKKNIKTLHKDVVDGIYSSGLGPMYIVGKICIPCVFLELIYSFSSNDKKYEIMVFVCIVKVPRECP